jgi:putative flippase GtrA
MMKLFSKIIGFVVAIVHVFFMYNLWTYHNKKLNKEIN